MLPANVRAKSGSVEDIQNAIDEAIRVGANTVIVPEGHFIFDPVESAQVRSVGGINILGENNGTVLDLPDEVTDLDVAMLTVDGTNQKPVRISGITFVGRKNEGSETSDVAIALYDVKDFRVDHCRMEAMGGVGVLAANPNVHLLCQGVVDHCDFINIYKPATTAAGRGYGYGVAVRKAWDVSKYSFITDPAKLFGQYHDNTFIEDCYFYNARHAIMSFAAGHYVARHNRIVSDILHYATHEVDAHPARGPSVGAWTYSGECAEVYNNEVIALDAKDQPDKYPQDWVCPVCGGGIDGWHSRISGLHAGGGCGVWFNNTLRHLITAFVLEGAETDNPEAKQCWIRNFYIWNNKTEDVWNELGLNDNVVPAPTEWDPTSATPEPDSWYSRNPPPQGYTPYPYPHPLTMPTPPPLPPLITEWVRTGLLALGAFGGAFLTAELINRLDHKKRGK